MKQPHKELKFHVTVQEINEYGPCYPAESKAGTNWSGTLIDILKMSDVSPQDKLWVVSRFAGDKTNRLFAVHCARQALMLIENPDPRSIAACDVAEAFALGKATLEELNANAANAANAAAATAANANAYAAAANAYAAANAEAWTAQIEFLIKMLEDQT